MIVERGSEEGRRGAKTFGIEVEVGESVDSVLMACLESVTGGNARAASKIGMEESAVIDTRPYMCPT
jgi:hypothetical protein